MADALKVLGQVNPAAATPTDLYVVPAGKMVTSSSLVVCNRGAVPATFRVSVAVANAADAAKQYLYYGLPIGANDTFIATIGMTLATTDVVRVWASTADLAFNLFGDEVT